MPSVIRAKTKSNIITAVLLSCATSGCGESFIERYYPSPDETISVVEQVSMYGGAGGSSSSKFFIEEIYVKEAGYARKRHLIGTVYSEASGQFPRWVSDVSVNVCDLSAPKAINRKVVLMSKKVISVETKCRLSQELQ